MNTPICDFIREYAAGNPVRMHMPGHKGKTLLGPETADITADTSIITTTAYSGEKTAQRRESFQMLSAERMVTDMLHAVCFSEI